MLPSRLAAFICLTLASLATAACRRSALLHDKDTFTLYLYKGYDCTGTVLKHKSKPVDGVCRNLPVPTKNKKTGPNWNDRVRSLSVVLPPGASLKMFRDQYCKNEYGLVMAMPPDGWWAAPNMTREVKVYTELEGDEMITPESSRAEVAMRWGDSEMDFRSFLGTWSSRTSSRRRSPRR
ncbi:hypothetical protein BJ138DRAFT_1131357 [Hygrophoropsis aurantiaca]|uniref:Uncharacterized protein n=1 Tax=Hygrophoropsis aurantiaca TaxID=72124 RepID=A0ACB7ZS07_9AGAM|nr:hypothetical protein BJ138DRAFT_1131357 [Hygrophoropsis aurantiaca]